MNQNHFAVSLKSYLERSGSKAVEIERAAGFQPASIAKLLAGQRPSVDRLAAILRSVPDDEAAKLLRAYLIDDIPEDWRSRVTILIDVLSSSRLNEPAADAPADSLSLAIESLRRAAAGDVSLSQWLVDTAALLNLSPD